jgi:hypothetical protein
MRPWTRELQPSKYRDGKSPAPAIEVLAYAERLTGVVNKDEPTGVRPKPPAAFHTADVGPSLENLGLAGFSHEFKALVTSGETPELIHVIESFKLPASGDVLSKAFFFLSPLLPWLLKLPSDNTRLLWRLRFAMKDIADNLLEKTKQELEMDGSGAKVTDKSIIGTLSKSSLSVYETGAYCIGELILPLSQSRRRLQWIVHNDIGRGPLPGMWHHI